MNDLAGRPRAPITAEYLEVRVKGREGESIDVKIDGLRMGRTGQLIQITPGRWEVSVGLKGYPPQMVEVRNTTYNNPKVVVF